PSSLMCTLFPYTTLFRSRGKSDRCRVCDQSADHLGEEQYGHFPRPLSSAARAVVLRREGKGYRPLVWRPHADDALANRQEHEVRSEEHTSELQSLAYLVC